MGFRRTPQARGRSGVHTGTALEILVGRTTTRTAQCSHLDASGASAGSPQTRTEPAVQLRLLIMKRWWAWPLLSLPPRTVGNTPTPSRKARISGSWHLSRSLLAPFWTSRHPASAIDRPRPGCSPRDAAICHDAGATWGLSSSLDESVSESSQTLLMAWEDASCKTVCDRRRLLRTRSVVWCECKLQNSPFLGR